MGVSGGPNIVRGSSLILELDAADRNSYPGSGTSWSDVGGNNSNATLVNGVTYNAAYNGGFSFNAASSNYITLPAVINTNADFTIIFTSNRPEDTGTVFSGAPGTTSGNLQIRTNISSVSLVKNTIAELGNFGANSGTPIGKPFICAIGLNKAATTSYCYINGVFISTLALNQTFTTTNPVLGASTNGEYFTGTIHNFSFYNRLLSATEIVQNYNSLKSRFGLI
jgi:hypothetical protein